MEAVYEWKNVCISGTLEMLWKRLLAFVLRIAERRSGMRFCNENENEVILWIYEAF